MLELDIVVGEYVKQRISKYTESQCDQFEKDIFYQETPDLYELLVGNRNQEHTKNQTINAIR